MKDIFHRVKMLVVSRLDFLKARSTFVSYAKHENYLYLFAPPDGLED